jgi:hypothetical protein
MPVGGSPTGAGESPARPTLQSSTGELVQPNQVLYPGAFADAEVEADLLLTYRIGSFEADIVLRSQPPSPDGWGLNPATTRIQVWHEMFEAPAGTKQSLVLRREDDAAKRATMAEPDFMDEDLDFGSVHIPQGRAFVLGAEPASGIPQPGSAALPDSATEGVPVGKEWTTISDPDTGQPRTFLTESVEYPSLKPLLDTLPVRGASLSATNKAATTASARRKAVDSRAGLVATLPKTTRAELLAHAENSAKRNPASGIRSLPSSLQTPRTSALALQTSPLTPSGDSDLAPRTSNFAQAAIAPAVSGSPNVANSSNCPWARLAPAESLPTKNPCCSASFSSGQYRTPAPRAANAPSR